MIRCFSLILFFLIPCGLSAQNTGSVIRISPEMFEPLVADIDTLLGIRGKCIVSEMDTLYLINPVGVKEFVTCSSSLERCRELYRVTEELETNIASLQEGMQSLDKSNASFREYALMFQQENAHKLQELETNNKVLEDNLQTIRFQLSEANEKLKAERWNSMGKKILWGAGGFVTGTIFATILVAAIR